MSVQGNAGMPYGFNWGANGPENPETEAAMELALSDVEAAFDAFLARRPASRPFILAGHSQGTMHVKRMMARLPARRSWRCLEAS